MNRHNYQNLNDGKDGTRNVESIIHQIFGENITVDDEGIEFSKNELMEFANEICMITEQMTFNKGLDHFGKAGEEAVLKELQQLHDRQVLKPQHGSKLSVEAKRRSLNYLMFLKEKRCGKIKARGCADGRKQRAYIGKEEASSPTVMIESLLLSCVIDAAEGRDVATVDIPGAFMQADMDETVHVRMEGRMAELIVKLDPKLYRPFIIHEKGKPVLYAELLKALYGTLRAALLFWELLSRQLIQWGFVVNPYDWCVANKTVNGKQCTVLWHVDDLKISHVETTVVDGIISQLNERFGKESPISINRGKVHDYLGMTLDFSVSGKVMIKMFDYIENILADLPEDFNGLVETPAAEHLFTVSENPVYLGTERAEKFHEYTAKLLFLCKRARPDLQTAVSFLTTRVKGPDEDDWKKLGRVMRYLRKTARLPLTLEAHDLHVLKWSVDASFAVHPDMRSHSGASMTMGKGTINGSSRKQKLNTKSSTEAELVGVDDNMTQIIWTRYFLEAQGYAVTDNILLQDNKSTILLENNGKASSSKRTRHVNIRYFFVTDRIKKGEVRVEYCPTESMVADYFSKPLQGRLFRKLRNKIMNCEGDDPDTWKLATAPDLDHRSVLGDKDINKDLNDGKIHDRAGQASVIEGTPARVKSTPAGDRRAPGENDR